jgi:hypothetical protein
MTGAICRLGSNTSSGLRVRGGILKNEWIVDPLTLIAASAVGATTAQFVIFSARNRISVDLPVPARPVTKTAGQPALIASRTN